jgi:tripartite-type tricarboxylate transporter receptor subunit TctC
MTPAMRMCVAAAFAFAAWCGAPAPAAADDVYPSKPIRMIVPLAPGGATDTIARIVAKQMSTELAVPVTIDNRTGAGGIIGMDAAVRAAPDGYTLFVGNLSTNALNQTVYADKLKFKPDDALMPVSMLATIPHLLVSSAKFEPTSVKELIAYAKANPGKVNHASPGVGSYSMLDMLNFEKAAGLQMVHVPYAGGAGQYIAPMVSNEVQIAFLNASSVIEMVRAGKLRALAVTTDKRLPELPNVPTMAEAGFPGIGTNAWQGLFVPKGTPKAVVDRLYVAVAEALKQPEVLETFKKQLIIAAVSSSPEEYGRFVKTEVSRWATIVSSLNVKVE